MRKLLNTLYVTSTEAYLSLDGENVVVQKDGEELARYPLHTLEHIISFSYSGASPALMGMCAKANINLCFCTPNGRFLARTVGKSTEMFFCVKLNIAFRIVRKKLPDSAKHGVRKSVQRKMEHRKNN